MLHINKFKEIEYSLTDIQGLNAKSCGQFCIHCIYVLSLGLNMNIFIDDYYNDFKTNDIIVDNLVDYIM